MTETEAEYYRRINAEVQEILRRQNGNDNNQNLQTLYELIEKTPFKDLHKLRKKLEDGDITVASRHDPTPPDDQNRKLLALLAEADLKSDPMALQKIGKKILGEEK